MDIVKASANASRRAKNHINRSVLQALRLNRSRDRVLLGDEQGVPIAWVFVDEIEELPQWMKKLPQWKGNDDE